MTVYAAVTTGKGSAAIATIEVFGGESGEVVERIFRPASGDAPDFEKGRVLLGSIVDGENTIDQVAVGCEGPETLAIHCHGNPLIVEQIAQLLQRHGAVLVSAEEMLGRVAKSDSSLSSIEIEAKLAQLKARTVAGTKLIFNQTTSGLLKVCQSWLEGIDATSLDSVKADAAEILRQSSIARLIIEGCTVVLVGPPNSGKSTLLNTLAGREKAIVSHIEGTTRDWVEAQCYVEPLAVTLIDTAGLDEMLACESDSAVDRDAQKRSSEMLEEADLVLLILDGSRPAGQLTPLIISVMKDKNAFVVLNKCDLPTAFDATALPEYINDPACISARDGTGINELHWRILQATGAEDFNLDTPIAFTDRQREIMSQLAAAESESNAKGLISKLLNDAATV